jgi:hypothetical protein
MAGRFQAMKTHIAYVCVRVFGGRFQAMETPVFVSYHVSRVVYRSSPTSQQN